jgi:hypothetical protein
MPIICCSPKHRKENKLKKLKKPVLLTKPPLSKGKP